MTKKLLIAFSTLMEAALTIEKLSFTPQKETGLYSNDKATIVITGIGPYAAFHSIDSLIADYDEILNIGIAGSLSLDIHPFEIHEIGTVSKFSFYPGGKENTSLYHSEQLLKPIEINHKPIKLITTDFTLTCTSLRKVLSYDHNLVDMEGYAIAHLCKTKQKKCRMIKLVSDTCDKNTSAIIKKNLHKYSESLFEFLSKSFELK